MGSTETKKKPSLKRPRCCFHLMGRVWNVSIRSMSPKKGWLPYALDGYFHIFLILDDVLKLLQCLVGWCSFVCHESPCRKGF